MSGRVLAVAVVAIGTALLTLGCDSDGGEPDSTPTATGVTIESISPIEAAFGDEITIRGAGFTTTDNDVGFSNPVITFNESSDAYVNDIPSPDGETLRFNLPDNEGLLLGACAFSQMGPDEGCPSVGLTLPTGQSEIFVANENGTSTSVTITVTDAATATPGP